MGHDCDSPSTRGRHASRSFSCLPHRLAGSAALPSPGGPLLTGVVLRLFRPHTKSLERASMDYEAPLMPCGCILLPSACTSSAPRARPGAQGEGKAPAGAWRARDGVWAPAEAAGAPRLPRREWKGSHVPRHPGHLEQGQRTGDSTRDPSWEKSETLELTPETTLGPGREKVR